MSCKYFFTICIAVLLVSCGNKNALPEGILKPVKMRAVLWDVLRADVFTYDFITKDTAKKPEVENVKLQQQIFSIHKTTRDVFYKSYEFYKSRPALMQPILDSIINKATNEKYSKASSVTAPPDTLKAQ
jgi:Domain of unknown function (DUF4296)